MGSYEGLTGYLWTDTNKSSLFRIIECAGVGRTHQDHREHFSVFSHTPELGIGIKHCKDAPLNLQDGAAAAFTQGTGMTPQLNGLGASFLVK